MTVNTARYSSVTLTGIPITAQIPLSETLGTSALDMEQGVEMEAGEEEDVLCKFVPAQLERG